MKKEGKKDPNIIQSRVLHLRTIFDKYTLLLQFLAEGEGEDNTPLEEYYYDTPPHATHCLKTFKSKPETTNAGSPSLDNVKL